MNPGHHYFAHSANPTGHRHTLREHLGCVAALAADFAQKAPWQSEARLTGLLHDLGKYGDLFQRRLDGLESGLDHWSAGAFVAGTSFGTLAAAAAIEGHHIGLQPALPASFSARLRDIKASTLWDCGFRRATSRKVSTVPLTSDGKFCGAANRDPLARSVQRKPRALLYH